MTLITQGNKEFFEYTNSYGVTTYHVCRINGQPTHGREGTYAYSKCPICGRIIGHQFGGYHRHMKTHKADALPTNT